MRTGYPDSEQKKFHQQNREKLRRQIRDGFALIPAATEKVRNHDVHFPYRQDSDFFYLTGLNEPDALLLLGADPGDDAVFLPPFDPAYLTWEGHRLIPGEANRVLGIAGHDFDEEEFPGLLESLLKKYAWCYTPFHENNSYFDDITGIVRGFTTRNRRFRPAFRGLRDLSPLIHDLRLIKRPLETNCMKKAAAMTAAGFEYVLSARLVGESEAAVENTLEYLFASRGSSHNAYPPIVAGGDSATILHYTDNNRVLGEGDLLLIDAGAEYYHYASDVTRTFPVGQKFTPAQREIYELVLNAQKRAIAMVRPGGTLREVHTKTSQFLLRGLVKLGILKGDLRKLKKDNALARFYMHGTGHWLGLDVHDQAPYFYPPENGHKPRPLEFKPGMVTTIEPGLYFPPTLKDIPAAYRGIGIRIEDNILVTRDGNRNLTVAIPKEINEIEERRGRAIPLSPFPG